MFTDEILAPFNRMSNERFRIVKLSVFDTRYYFRLRDYVGSAAGRRNSWPASSSVTETLDTTEGRAEGRASMH